MGIVSISNSHSAGKSCLRVVLYKYVNTANKGSSASLSLLVIRPFVLPFDWGYDLMIHDEMSKINHFFRGR